ncbi:hypothetical protein B0H14DRAFT_2559954 [Mycena olivaceomarginata]|nr:hypothetical protein B0H14DRAFT_2559954 [Mycena olivaceomarginata]
MRNKGEREGTTGANPTFEDLREKGVHAINKWEGRKLNRLREKRGEEEVGRERGVTKGVKTEAEHEGTNRKKELERRHTKERTCGGMGGLKTKYVREVVVWARVFPAPPRALVVVLSSRFRSVQQRLEASVESNWKGGTKDGGREERGKEEGKDGSDGRKGGKEEMSSLPVDRNMGRLSGIWDVRVKQEVGEWVPGSREGIE